MKTGRASNTAQAAAAIRAYDNLSNQRPLFHDAYAINMTSPAWRFILSNKALMRLLKTSPVRHAWDLLVTQVALRSAYSEDWLFEALDRGVKQYVMIDAGLDSFALRAAAKYPDVKIYEVDHPDTQALKIKILSEHGKIPENVEFVPINFEQEKLSEALGKSSYDANQIAHFSWLGTTHYLKPETTLSTLKDLASCAAIDSELVFDYSVPYQNLQGIERLGTMLLSQVTHLLNEPIIGFFNTQQLHDLMWDLGYLVVEDLSGKDITERYLAWRKNGMRHTDAAHLIRLQFI
ncbi:class I SAM-dependent methyltransferase [Acinetobacter sp. SwsAc6]|uniref:class I SAM-dependent methyltransferase n=1 Tax=Acinetobacter TaxID=469 RepID=UPI000EA16C22|nr:MULTISPECIES: class I SAM-dependent methyltransferase [Acinetobacter]NWK73888.1 class I SAM-dependent methyltransferase [Acinetobacter sp. SwsAc6]RKG46269.1 SAM-dependent methyltransferase [Acinetobacter cumulans]RZG61709.1 SAM-dependent methyltransferase [Acinetobacter sp. WCHAc060006]